jgi:hypothetical protein
MPYSRQAARFDNSPVKTRRRTSVHIFIAAYTPRASLSVGGYRGSAAILLTDTAAQLSAAFFDRPAYPAPRCTFRPAFTKADSSEGRTAAKYRGNHFHGCKQMTSETVATISTVAGRTVEKNDTNRGNHFHNPRKRKEQSVSLTASACHTARQTMVFHRDDAWRFLLFATSARATSRLTAARGPHTVAQRSRTLRNARTMPATHGHADGHARLLQRRVDAGAGG